MVVELLFTGCRVELADTPGYKSDDGKPTEPPCDGYACSEAGYDQKYESDGVKYN